MAMRLNNNGLFAAVIGSEHDTWDSMFAAAMIPNPVKNAGNFKQGVEERLIVFCEKQLSLPEGTAKALLRRSDPSSIWLNWLVEGKQVLRLERGKGLRSRWVD